MIKDVIQNTVMITSFVLVMMMIIEYVNVQTRGNWSKPLRKSRFMQVIVSAILGMIPGCLGTFTVVTLYTHRFVNFGALVAAMIATSGDEAFIMFSMIPKTALILTGIIFGLAIVVGLLITYLFKKQTFVKEDNKHFEIHAEENSCRSFKPSVIKGQLKNISFQRAILIAGISLFLLGLLTNMFSHDHNDELLGLNQSNTEVHDHDHDHNHDHHHHGHSHDTTESEAGVHNHEHSQWNWITITFLILSVIALFIIITVPDHFLNEHLWGHIIKKHFLKIFLWTLGALVAIGFLLEYTDFTGWIGNNIYYVLIAAVLIGIIPQSGPHLIFVSLFITGGIPFSVLLANSIVQDGHGALPLFAESKKSFVMMKLVNVIIGFIVGFIGIYAGF